MRPAASALRPPLSSSAGSTVDCTAAASASKRRKPGRPLRYSARPTTPAGEHTRFSELMGEVAQIVDQNQKAKQRAEEKRLSKQYKGKQRATEPLAEKSTAPPRSRTEELTDRTNLSTDGEDSWDADLGEASLMDIDPSTLPERRPERAAEVRMPKPKKPPMGPPSHVNTVPSRSASAHSKHPTPQPSPATEIRRSVSSPPHAAPKARPPVQRSATPTHPPQPKAQPVRTRDPSPPKPSSARTAPPPPPTQNRKPPALGMRRTNTHPGVSTTFRPSQELPTKQRGFKPPLARAPEQPSASFPVARRSPSPPPSRGASSAPVVEDPDSSYGDISLDADQLEEIMSQFD